jgi:biopolymer transport protein ExbB
MNFSDPIFRRLFFWVVACGAMLLVAWQVPALLAQAAAPPKPGGPTTMEETAAGREAGVKEAERRNTSAAAKTAPDTDATAAAKPVLPDINLWDLTKAGGPLMWPIGFVSIVALAFAVERIIALRRHKVMPPELIVGLGRLASQKGGLDLRQAYRLCQQFPSSAAQVVKSMLLKAGRPHSEVEHAVTEAKEREANNLYSNVRWQTLAVSVAPMLGLLGTIQGMIMAFFVTANLPANANKTQYLAQGIYVALVTTFAGLSVAIPAAIVAHMLENRIQKLFRELDEIVMGILPQLERFEGRLRVSKEQFDAVDVEPVRPLPPDEPKRKQPASTPP